ncbi:Holliday junction resolvase RecU [Indiicoccus explosivorum]|uniref:Holliday junction resolvase RecU n=1 Tax=Indiicoccus explosivorum TaxID=1917864 RepID=UPI000B446358|nr:Holliday junction resolvase RecU [Indiicoccus explosivorum]
MGINYPNGKKFTPAENPPARQNNGRKKPKKDLSFSNRGKTLEDELNESNSYYLSRGQAVIHKKPVPLQIVKVDYPSRNAAVVREAYFRTPSTTDYNGVWNGKHVDFEAKETRNKTSFPLKNIHEHQIRHMKQVSDQGGVAFMIIRFAIPDRYFAIPFPLLESSWERMQKGGRKSIGLDEIEKAAVEISPGMYPRLDYLPALEQLLGKTESEEQ